MSKQELMKLDKEQLVGLLMEAFETIETVVARVNAIEYENAELKEEIKILKNQINKNSSNSSKPPSSDGYKKPAPKSMRESSGKKQGGQLGHEGHGLKITREPDETVTLEPSECWNCGKDLSSVAGDVTGTRYKIDLNQVKCRITRICTVKKLCPECEVTNASIFPEDIASVVQYGENVKAFATALVNFGMVSIERTHELMSGVFEIPISTGTIANMIEECAEAVSDTVKEIADVLKEGEIAHFDETGFRVEGKLHWMHSASNREFTHMTVDEKRGIVGIDANGVLPMFLGVAVHDCWSPYFTYENCLHALCNAHLLRELTGIYEETGQQWSSEMKVLLLEMKSSVEASVLMGERRLPPNIVQEFGRKYDEILIEGIRLNPLLEKVANRPGRTRRSKARCLLDRLVQHKEEVCRFANDFIVPFDNNQAERDIRIVKVKQKVSGGFRTKDGADDFAKITSFIETAKKHGLSVFKSLVAAFQGNSSDTIFDSATE